MSSVEGADQLIRRLQAIGEPEPVLRALQLETIAEANKLVPRKTGFLARSIVPGRITHDSAIVRAGAPYAAAVEFGTRPHIIKPRNAKVLAWGGPRRLSGRLRSGGQATHFAKIVHHPGTKAQPFLFPGAQAAVDIIREVIVKLWNKAA